MKKIRTSCCFWHLCCLRSFSPHIASAQEYTAAGGRLPVHGENAKSPCYRKIKELIESKSGGKMTVQIFLDNQLGGDGEIL